MRARRTLLLSVLLLFLAGCGPGPAVTTPALTSVPGTTAPTVVLTPVVVPTPTVVPTPAGPQAHVVDLVNSVDAHPMAGQDWIQALVDMTIYMGGEVWAKEESTARVALEEDLIRVAPNTIFTLRQPDADTMQIDLQDGQIWLNVEGGEDKTFLIQTPDAVAGVRGTRFSVRTLPEGGTLVSTVAGTVTLSVGDDAVTVTAGLQGAVPAGGPPAEPVTMTLEERMRWGNAAGAGLDAVFPAVLSTGTFTHAGSLYGSLSPDGRTFLGGYHWQRSEQEYESGLFVYDIVAGEVVSSVVPADGYCPAYSPDGQLLAYSYSGPTGDQMCTMPVAGGPAACVGEAESYIGCPFWSPDGQWIAFYQKIKVDKYFNLYKVRRDGSDMQPLTTGQDTDKSAPEWSPDGVQIAYVALTYAAGYPPGELWVMDADGGNARKLMDQVYGYGHPYWDPAGQTLLVRGAEEGPTQGLWLVPAAGGTPGRIPGTEAGGFYGLWSPSSDGWPLLLPYYDSDAEIRTLYYCRGYGQPLEFLAAPDWGPIWSADKQTVAFGDRTGTMADEVTTIDFMRFVSGLYSPAPSMPPVPTVPPPPTPSPF